ncbi:MAG: PKD domain-containing protein [Prolixibacteraceae bacterium]
MKKIKLAGFVFLGLILFVTCKKETPAPTASFTAAVNDGIVTFTAVVTNESKYEWDFGDGSYINTFPSPVHTYTQAATPTNITVSLTIKGAGGEVTTSNKIVIPAKTQMQYLTGGTPAAAKSRKWKINSGAAFFDVTFANATFTSQIPDAYKFGGVLNSVGLGAAYLDEFVFKSDGTMTINSKGGGIFSSLAYCMGNGVAMATYYADLGLAYAKAFTPPTAATFTINEGKDLTISTPLGNVTYPKVMTLSFNGGGFLGVKDFTSECIIKKLTDTEMNAIVFYAHPSYGAKPMLALNLTFQVVN